jgi:hypothetical protein
MLKILSVHVLFLTEFGMKPLINHKSPMTVEVKVMS